MNDKNPDEDFALPPDSPAPYSLSMEARVAVLEEIARNTEKLLGKMDARMDRMETHSIQMEARLTARMDAMDERLTTRIDRLETHTIQMEERLTARMEAMEERLIARIESGEARTDKRMETMEERLITRIEAGEARTDKRMESFEVHLVRLEDRHITDFRWMLGLGMGAVAFLFAVMAHGFHWF